MNQSRHSDQAYCPVCSTPAGTYATFVLHYQIKKCPACGLEYTHPIPSNEELEAFYQGYTDPKAPTDITSKNAQKNIEFLRTFGLDDHSLILDFGAGDGDFVHTAGSHCYGIDFKPSDSPQMYTNMSDLPVKQFDFITLWGVLEHLNTPVDTMKMLSRWLRPGGKIVLTTVDAEGLIPYYHKPVEHLTYWTSAAFEALFAQCNCTLIQQQPYRMYQRAEIYLDRLLSRTPVEYKEAFSQALPHLPKYLEVPTNETLLIGQKKPQDSSKA